MAMTKKEMAPSIESARKMGEDDGGRAGRAARRHGTGRKDSQVPVP